MVWATTANSASERSANKLKITRIIIVAFEMVRTESPSVAVAAPTNLRVIHPSAEGNAALTLSSSLSASRRRERYPRRYSLKYASNSANSSITERLELFAPPDYTVARDLFYFIRIFYDNNTCELFATSDIGGRISELRWLCLAGLQFKFCIGDSELLFLRRQSAMRDH